MAEFDPLASFFGGALIGLAAVLLMFLHGRIAGLSGILTGTLLPSGMGEWAWRFAFLAGAILAPMLLMKFAGYDIAFEVPVPTSWLIVGGVIAGLGVTFGSGCTSGHGICGNARFSARSIVATLVFMAAAGSVVYLIRHVIGA